MCLLPQPRRNDMIVKEKTSSELNYLMVYIGS